ncbi:MAG: ribose 5-phosphate isomerase B [Phycisphaeraceae bacterium]|nr:ribose 5-phosphate isomerase B [Phycisphaeraceae bacterium]
MKIAIAADHGGYDLKAPLTDLLRTLGHEVVDLGAHQFEPQDDFPDYARYIGQAIQHGQAERGVLLCGSGVGACIAANKIKGVRASVCHDAYSARQGVEHDDMNVLCLGARIIGIELARVLVEAFVGAKFKTDERFLRRLEKVKAIEAGNG